ncbi:MAG: DUF134 domain-containing protein [Anaerovoracaceae bacterium]|jgi:predicted DNA-binding protein (UPF0251 family)
MPRPTKRRKVCYLPENNLFGSINAFNQDGEIIIMTVEEYETIRLIDLEGMMQEECAEKMKVARTTVQKIYKDARKKLADSLVNGNLLKIEGGDYKLCDGNKQIYGCGRCHRHRLGQKNSIAKTKNEEDVK